MLTRLSKLRERRVKAEHGFTLIELLVVVVILGILIAIAIPLYLNYRKGANDASAKSDLRNAVNVLEQCNTDGGNYPTVVGVTGSITGGCAGTINVSNGTTFTYYASAATTPTDYIMVSTNSNGTGKKYCYASAAAGVVRTSAAITSFATSCPAPVGGGGQSGAQTSTQSSTQSSTLSSAQSSTLSSAQTSTQSSSQSSSQTSTVSPPSSSFAPRSSLTPSGSTVPGG